MKKKEKKIKFDDLSGSIFLSLGRAFKLAIANILRNKVLSVATIMVMAVILFIFNIIIAIQVISNQALQALNERVDIVVYLRDDIGFYDANKLSDTIQRLEGIKNVKYTSKEEAMEIVAKTHPRTAEFIKKFNLRNPLPPSISIITSSPEAQNLVTNLLAQPEYASLTRNYINEGATGESVILSEVAKNLGSISHFVRQIIFWMVLVFVIGGTLVVVNAIQLTIYTRRNEIYIMRLVGATPNFIRMPFVFEGIIYGISAVLISFIILATLGTTIQLDNSNLWIYYNNLHIERVFLAEIIITTFLAIISSYSSVQKYLKGKLTVN